MVRPSKCRKIYNKPNYSYFKPAGIPGNNAEEVILTLDEFEAIRLADYLEQYHEQSSKQMNVSRQTFGNIVASAHKKIADSIINGKILKIEGGNIEISNEKNIMCSKCMFVLDSGEELKCQICHRNKHFSKE